MLLVADIGGTNARFALCENRAHMLQHVRTLSCANYASLVDAVLAYLDEVSQPMPQSASLAIATPVTGDQSGRGKSWY